MGSDSISAGTRPEQGDAIAIVGLACRLPGAPSPDAFWSLLRAGSSAIVRTPAGRWGGGSGPGGDVAPPRGPGTCFGGFLDDIDQFDADFFDVSPREAAVMDPQQRLVLELAWEALEDAGIVPAALNGSRTGVFVGAMWDDYATLLFRQGTAAIDQHTLTGLQRSIIANRVSYTLGLRGPSLTVDSGQSSSLVAVQMACESLRAGESTLALAGGVNLNLTPESTISADRFGGLSPDGRCYTFDARANGYVRGEGAATVVLKPLHRAIADGDPIYCVIRGGGVNNNGAGPGLTVPDPAAQAEVLRLAYANAGVDPADVQYVECHGTGTRVGDPVEAAALGSTLGAARSTGPLLIGSAKTNIGHLEGAAGIVGLLKAVLSIKHRQIPASLNFETPNPQIPLEALNLLVQDALTGWPRPDRPLLAGVSSFGMGGTNCHLVLSEPGPGDYNRPQTRTPTGAQPSVVSSVLPWLVSGRGPGGLRGQAERLRAQVAADPGLDLADVGLSLATTRSVFDHRAVIVTADRAGIMHGLDALAHGGDAACLVRGAAIGTAGPNAFVFPGQGSQWRGMAVELLAPPECSESRCWPAPRHWTRSSTGY
jgi:acyl transferase domain-containing protein